MDSAPCQTSNESLQGLKDSSSNERIIDNENSTIESEIRNNNLQNTADSIIDDEDLVLGEVEPSKDFSGNIDEDELLKDTEGDDCSEIINNTKIATNKSESCSSQKDDKEIVYNANYNELQSIENGKEKPDEIVLDKEVEENIMKENTTNEKNELDNFNSSENNESNDCIKMNTNENEFDKSQEENNLKTCDMINRSLMEENEIGTVDSPSNLDSHVNINECSVKSISSSKSVENKEVANILESNPQVNTETSVETENTNEDTMKENCNKSDSPSEKRDIDPDNKNKIDKHDILAKTTEASEEILNTSSHEGNNSMEIRDSNSDDEKRNDKIDDTCDATRFEHVDQESSRQEETIETMDITGEDPFAQTSDDTMDTSDHAEKEDVDKQGKSNSEIELMDVDDVTSVTHNSTSHETQSGKITCKTTARSMSDDSNEIFKCLPDKVRDITDKEDEPQNSKKTDNVEVTESAEKIKNSVPSSIIHISQGKENNDKSLSDVSILRPRYTKSLSKSKSKKISSSSSEDSESDFDLEDIKTNKERPKRNAAKKAESQIKVISQIDQQTIEQLDEDIDSGSASKSTSNDPPSVEEIPDDESVDVQTCFICKKVGQCKINVPSYGKTNHFCDNDCFIQFRDGPLAKPTESTEIVPSSTVMQQLRSADIQPLDRAEFIRKCSHCSTTVNGEDEKILSWETMDFCSEECLGKYQQELGSHCANCKGSVQPASLGKYCVRFGYEVKQFCCSTCLEEFKKGLKVCSFCQKDISSGAEGFLAPVGDKGTFKDFCTPACMEKYEQMSSNNPPPPQMLPCDVCNNKKLVEIEVFFDSKVNKLCSDICFTAYKFANKLTVDRCDMCRKYFDKEAEGDKFNIFYEGIPHNFCSKTCMNVYILAKRKIVPCNWCKVKKYNFDMIKRVQSSGQVLMMCSLNCLTLYQVSVNAVSSKRIKCDMCNSIAQAQYHLTMSDATIRNFCTYPCVMNFQQQYSKSPITLPGSGDGPPIPTGAPKRVVHKGESPVISSVSSLANGQSVSTTSTSTSAKVSSSGKLNLIARLKEKPAVQNKFTQTRPIMCTKSVSCRPHSNCQQTQTDEGQGKMVIPIPVPIYVPCPMAMYSIPFPVPVPFPLPIPVPVFLPTTRNSIKGIEKEIKRIREKMPDDPFEAELLMMAEMVAEDKKEDKTSSDSEHEPSRPNSDVEEEEGGAEVTAAEEGEREFSPEPAESSNTFGDDLMQMALNMATELNEPPVDLESELPPNTINNQNDNENSEVIKKSGSEARGRKRSASTTKTPPKRSGSLETKKRKTHQNSENLSSQSTSVVEEPKPDANMKLKYMFGVNAWKSWVTQKNSEIEKLSSTNKKIRPFKTDLLQLTVDELNFALSLFVKEVKKPNGTPYAPDTIYYLCLGIQLFLYENGRIENIFTDSYFETFTDALDGVAKNFSELFTDHHYIVTRVEEEHLWECKQLGAHSPHVLLSTLMFFNTKYFNLTNVDEHMMLSFSHIMKHWKRNPNQSASTSGRAQGSRNVLLRFYPPQSLLDDPNKKKKKVYEQHENEENPLRCPVKLYEFYLSKCPESVKNRNDVFYLQPERSCVPDSPVWYSTMALQKEPLEKMLNRVKMVKEINIALLIP